MRRSATSLPALRGNHRLRSTTEVALEGDGKVRFNTDLLSAILNLICPDCGAAMGGRSREFECRGRCGKDWRPEWERLRAQHAFTAAPKLSAMAPIRIWFP